MTILTKNELFRTICNASRLGTLGFFIGAGFSKAVLEGNPRYRAYKWGELLETCCENLNIDGSVMDLHCSYPELATKICNIYSETNEKPYEEAVRVFKTTVCELINSYPEQERRESYGKWFKKISPSWITTTNYDTIIESILGGSALPITPNSCFCNINGMIPVFHLHGICNEPDDIVITFEDYAYLFRPNDYRQARLPFLMKESCVLMIGYGLGDINVITAVDWANNVYKNVNDGYDFPIIQLLYTKNPKMEPYVGESNIIIYEIESIEAFFDDLNCFMDDYREEYTRKTEIVENNVKYLNNTEEDNIRHFIDNYDKNREIIIEFFKNLEPEFGYVYNSFFQFVRVVFARLDELSRPSGAFEAYNKKLCLILDILISVPIKKIPTSFFALLANELNIVANYVNCEGSYILGYSFSATDSWRQYMSRIPKTVIDELWLFAKSSKYDYTQLKNMLNSIPKEKSDVLE